MSGHQSWQAIKAARLQSPEARAAYDQAGREIELGRRVRQLREAADITQAELAARVGTSQSAIARLEAGGGSPKLDTLDRVAHALGVELVVELRAS
ncbi:MAG: helix-turn-helix transcriptional regulator [Actinomycetota bacterium]|jgi:ribosome-binding protein aMBF1 (putative translation factor)